MNISDWISEHTYNLAHSFFFNLLTKAEMADALAPFKVDVGLASERAFDTRQIHGGAKPDSATKARAVPIYATAVRPFVAQC